MPAHRSRLTDSTSCPSRPLTKTPAQVFIQQNAHSLICHSVRLRLLQQGKDLLPLYTGKPFEKVCNGVSGLKMVKQILNRYSGPGKDSLASQNFRVPRDDFFHGNIIAPAATLSEPKLLPFMEATIWDRRRFTPHFAKPCANLRDAAVSLPSLAKHCMATTVNRLLGFCGSRSKYSSTKDL
jgi:hypothetical protein